MKTLILLFLFPFLAQAQFFSEHLDLVRPDQKNRSLYVRQTGSDDDLRDIANMYTAAIGAAIGSELSWNSGSLFPRNPLPAQGKVTQFLRGLAIFDNYLTAKVQHKEADPNFVATAGFDFVGMRSTKDYFDHQVEVKADFERQGLKQVFETLSPVFNGAIRKLPEDFRTNELFIAEAHSAMETQISTRFPISRKGIDFSITDNLKYFADSYLPLMMYGHLEVHPKGSQPSKLHVETLLPRIGELITPKDTLPDKWYIRPIVQPKEKDSNPIKIHEISLGKYMAKDRAKNFAIKVITDKDFSKPNEMIVTLEFGQVRTGNTHVLGSMDFGHLEEGLVARGNLIGHDDVKVRLSFQRLVLKLTRPMTGNKWASENDYEFSYETIPEKMISSLALDVPIKGIMGTPMGEWPLRAALYVGGSLGSCDEQAGYCTYYSNQQNGNIIDKLLLKFVNKQAGKAVQEMIPGSILDADKSTDNAIDSLMQQVGYALDRIDSVLKELGQYQKQ